MATDSDFDLLDAWKAGDQGAGDQLLRQHFDALYRFFSNKAPDQADDLTQRTLLGCIEHRDRFAKRSSFRTYLFTIARHQLFDHLRRQLRRPADENLSNMSLRDLNPSPSSRVARDERENALDAALAGLPLDQQIAIELTYRNGMESQAVAEVLEVEASTVRSRLTRARQALRKALEGRGIVLEDLSRR